MVSSFSVVEFLDEVDTDGCKKMDIIPVEWFKGTDRKLCWWPPGSLANITKVVKEHTSPASNWIVCNVREMGNAATYSKARAKLHQAEYSSDLTDTENISRKISLLVAGRPSAKLLQSQLSTQLESSEHSDSSEELPPTPPNQLLWPAKKVSNYFQNPTDQHVASYTPLRNTSHAAQQGASTTNRGITSPIATVTSPRDQGVTTPTATVTSPTARGVSSSTARRATSPTATVTSPRDQGVTSATPRGVSSSIARRATSPTATVTSPRDQGVTSATPRGVSSSIARRATSPTATITSPTCEAMFTKLLTILEEVKETQRVHGKMLNALLKKQDGSVVEVPEGVALPLKTQSDLEALDQKLGDRSVMSAVVTMVADVGGTSVDDTTRRMMKYILSNELALEYNFFGRHGKKKFKDLRLFNIVYGREKRRSLSKPRDFERSVVFEKRTSAFNVADKQIAELQSHFTKLGSQKPLKQEEDCETKQACSKPTASAVVQSPKIDLSQNGVETEPQKIQTNKTWPSPKTLKELRSFLGFSGYYRRFIRDYAKIAKPLNDLTVGYPPLCKNCKGKNKKKLTTAPVLGFADDLAWASGDLTPPGARREPPKIRDPQMQYCLPPPVPL
ncbi:uncharacterized protein [Sinocyclocheilus grahami]|uniref:uncharacterized protein n=1 Tax=Sinocyclocheilus grahami TaxID=75366 RepID=UPI0007ACECE6|nr:PREDICTED: uncharacterized protein LOC107560069 [Sinocyclocheilus grahami]